MCAPMPSSPKLQLNPQIQSYIGANGDLSHADLMWSLFLLGHQNLSGICKELVVKNGDQWQWDWTMCSEYRHHSRCNIQHNWEGTCDYLKRKRILTLTSYNFCISSPIVKLEMTIPWFAIARRMEEFPSQANHHKVCAPYIGVVYGKACR